MIDFLVGAVLGTMLGVIISAIAYRLDDGGTQP